MVLLSACLPNDRFGVFASCCLVILQVPHDRPVVSQRMIETWIESAEQGLDEFHVQAAQRQHQQQQEQQEEALQHQQLPALSGLDSSPHKQTRAAVAVA
jgi:hypothetical protein